MDRLRDDAAQQLQQSVERNAAFPADAVPGAARLPRPAHAETLSDPPQSRHRRHPRTALFHRHQTHLFRSTFHHD